MVLPEVRNRVRELPIEVQDSICCNVYRCIVPYLEVLYLLEDKDGDMMKMEVEAYMERLNHFLHVTMEGLKEKLQKKLEQIESLISRAMGQADANKALESLRDAVSNVKIEMGKLEGGESGAFNLMEKFSPLQATQQVIADLIIMSKSRAKHEGWKKWYKCVGEYERDLKDAVAVYYKIGKSAMEKTTRGAILHFCPSFKFHP
ncbi:PREDICTED: uncharacterized protein LOC109187953 [Ipomoea nil]|uniref:uncharacterized protein LOC109187953 n=1 Tax=Ipomoea nil TaxID=35883 RepID=UPI00090108AA|nr:PREDICTED: uncharacterized protein LOC109187953 [Ipomoea nil]